jgi:histidinol-phosphate aminotransferase
MKIHPQIFIIKILGMPMFQGGTLMKVASEIVNLIPYRPGKPISETQREYGLTKVVKLASNENPLGPSPKAVQAISLALNELHRYPDPLGYELVQKIAKCWSLPSDHIAFGNGSNEVIDVLIRIFCEPRQDKIASFDKAFIAYPICAQAARVQIVTVPVTENFDIDLDQMADVIEKDPAIRLVFVPNPNNPTGTYLKAAAVERFLQRVGRRENLLIAFDEAYHEYVEAGDYSSALKYIRDYPSVLVMRTFSKVYGLAGLRLGVLIANPKIIDYYHRVRNPFNTNHLAQIAAVSALDDTDFILKSQNLVWDGKKQITSALAKMGLTWTSTQGNFLLFDTYRDAAKINELLLRKGVILRPVGNYGLPGHMRWTIGSVEENKFVIEALQEVLPQVPSIKGLK